MTGLLGSYRAASADRQWLTRGALLYTTCDEDSASEMTALEPAPGDTVLSITGSGCRSLALLAGGPDRLVSVDANPLQNHLLELKAEGIRRLDRAEFLAFVGIAKAGSRHRREVYDGLRGGLSAPAREFWDLNRRVIGRGVIFSGAHETFYRRFIGPSIRLLRRRRLQELYAFDDLAAQSDFYRRRWDHAGWRLAVHALARPTVVRLLLADPSYYAHVERPVSFADHLLERLRTVFDHRLARDNDVFTMYVFGRYLDDEALPFYLRPAQYDAVRAHLDRLEIVTADVAAHLVEMPDRSVDKVSLSDISGWADPATFDGIVRDAARALRPGGRLVYRNFLADRPLPEHLHGPLEPLPDLEDELARTDRAFAFTFVVAQAAPVPAEPVSS